MEKLGLHHTYLTAAAKLTSIHHSQVSNYFLRKFLGGSTNQVSAVELDTPEKQASTKIIQNTLSPSFKAAEFNSLLCFSEGTNSVPATIPSFAKMQMAGDFSQMMCVTVMQCGLPASCRALLLRAAVPKELQANEA